MGRVSKCDEIEIQIFSGFSVETKAAEIYATRKIGVRGSERRVPGLGKTWRLSWLGVDRNSDLLVHQLVLVAYQS